MSRPACSAVLLAGDDLDGHLPSRWAAHRDAFLRKCIDLIQSDGAACKTTTRPDAELAKS